MAFIGNIVWSLAAFVDLTGQAHRGCVFLALVLGPAPRQAGGPARAGIGLADSFICTFWPS